MGTSLTGLTPSTTYDALIKVGDNGALSATAKYLSDGLGNDSPLSMSTTLVGIGTLGTETFALSDRLRVRGGAIQVMGENVSNTRYRTLISSPQDFRHFYLDVSADTSNAVIAYFGKNINGAETDFMTLNNGNVGIGTNSPQFQLEVTGAVGGYQAGLVALKTYSKIAGFQLSSYQSVNGAPYTKTTDLVANADSGVASELRVLVASSGSNPSEIARFTPNGLTFNGDTAAANALDDYEEGQWTMGMSFGGGTTGITYATNTGTYTKIGRKVTVNGIISLSSKGSSTGDARITGLPFTIASGAVNYASASFRLNNVTFLNQFQGYGEVGATTIVVEEITSLGATTPLGNADFANNSDVIISMTYFV
jgi:hypothetical protein